LWVDNSVLIDEWTSLSAVAPSVVHQVSANQLYSTLSWVTNTIPTITVPVVAKARAAGDEAADDAGGDPMDGIYG